MIDSSKLPVADSAELKVIKNKVIRTKLVGKRVSAFRIYSKTATKPTFKKGRIEGLLSGRVAIRVDGTLYPALMDDRKEFIPIDISTLREVFG